MEREVLIVGAGMAGLVTAAYLAKAGRSVLLCEKQNWLGGLVNTFEHHGYKFDGGIRAIESSGIIFPMLRQLGLEIDFLPSPVSIGIGNDVVRLDSKESIHGYRELLVRSFPERAGEIDAIIADISNVMGYMDILYGIDNPLFMNMKDPEYLRGTLLPWFLKYLRTMPKISRLGGPVEERLAKLSGNRALIDMIAQHFFRATPAFFALSYFSLYLEYLYPRGGTGTITRELARFAQAHGAEIRMNTGIVSIDPVRKIAVDANGARHGYDELVWAADQKALYAALAAAPDAAPLPRSLSNKIEAHRALIADKSGGDSILSLYLCVNRAPEWFGRISSPHFFHTPLTEGLSKAPRDAPLNEEFPGLLAWTKRYLEHTTFEISIPVLRDPAMAPPGKTGVIISTLFDYSVTRRIMELGGYDEFKRSASAWIMEILEASVYPGLVAAVEEHFMSSPLSVERMTGSTEGAITGWAFTNQPIPAVDTLVKIKKATETGIPHILQAGQWTFSPSGLPIAALTGKLAADQVIARLGNTK
jgi:phytoene dehydrogenase-like protein